MVKLRVRFPPGPKRKLFNTMIDEAAPKIELVPCEQSVDEQVRDALHEREAIKTQFANRLYTYLYRMNNDTDTYVPWDRKHEINAMPEDERQRQSDYGDYQIYQNGKVRRNNLTTVASTVDDVVDLGFLPDQLESDRKISEGLGERAQEFIGLMEREEKMFHILKWYAADNSLDKEEIKTLMRGQYSELSEKYPDDKDFFRDLALNFSPELAGTRPEDTDLLMKAKLEELTHGKSYLDNAKYIPIATTLAYDTLRAMYPEFDLLSDDEFEEKLGSSLSAQHPRT